MTSISEDIIEGRIQDITLKLKNGAEVNFVDEYGFTPLIQAAIMDSFQIASLLLRHNADPNMPGSQGSTPLQWAVDNSNYELCEILLKYKANPNSYTPDGQPVLFYPTLRKQRDLVDLLLKYGAKENFVKDYTLAKLIGHRFELRGYTDILNADGAYIEIDFEGFFLEFTISLILESLERFMNSFEAHRLHLPIDEVKLEQQALNNAAELRSFRHFNKKIEDYLPIIRRIIKEELLLIPVSFRGHAMTFIKHKELFARCDRGVQKMTDPIVIYKLNNTAPLNLEFYQQLMYQKNPPNFINKEINELLELEEIDKLPIKHQVTGNCSWANVESSVPTMLYMIMHNRARNAKEAAEVRNYIMNFYRAWKEWDKDRSLEDCLYDIKDPNKARRASKATLLGAILFQSCHYANPRDVVRAKKILPILTQPEFKFVLRSYISVYIRSGKGKSKERFERLLEVCDFNYKEFF